MFPPSIKQSPTLYQLTLNMSIYVYSLYKTYVFIVHICLNTAGSLKANVVDLTKSKRFTILKLK